MNDGGDGSAAAWREVLKPSKVRRASAQSGEGGRWCTVLETSHGVHVQ